MKLLQKFKNNINAKNKKTRFILSIIGAFLYRIGGVSLLGISNFNVYITSYFHYKKSNIDMQYGNLIMPIFFLSNSLFSPFAGFFEVKIGSYLTLILGTILIELGLLLFINQTNALFLFIIIFFLGFSHGISMEVPSKYLLTYYPEKNGIIISLIGLFISLLSSFFNIIGEKFINPEKYTLSKEELFFPLEISQRYILFYKYILFINPISQIIGLFLIKKHKPEDEEKSILENGINEAENKEKNKIIKDENYFKNIVSIILNKRLWHIIGITTLSPFAFYFSNTTFRVYGALTSINGTIMQYNSLILKLPNIIFSPIWGYINDKFRYEIRIKLLCGCNIFEALFFSIFIKSNTAYLICTFLGASIICGFISACFLHYLKVYGVRYYLEVKGIIGIFEGIFSIIYALISYIISKFYQTGEELQFIYRFVYISAIVFSGIGFYLCLYEKENKFIYPYLFEKKKEYVNMINSDINEKIKGINGINEPKEFELELESNTSEITNDSI